jgi:sortase A
MSTVETVDAITVYDDAGDTDLPRLPPEPRAPRDWRLKVRVRQGALVLVLLLVAYVVQTRVVAEVVYQQRQKHLAADLGSPTPIIEQGAALGYLQIPVIGLNQVMVEGVTADHLRSGPAHRSDTVLPGDLGPMVVYGHRHAYGGPFRRIAELKEGDPVIAEAASGGPIVQYVVQRVERDVELAAIELDKVDQLAYLLLVTAEPGWFADDVTVVVARALPVTDAEPVTVDLADGPDGELPLSLGLVLGNLSAVGAVLAWRFLKERSSATVRALVVAPVALFAVVSIISALEMILPMAR